MGGVHVSSAVPAVPNSVHDIVKTSAAKTQILRNVSHAPSAEFLECRADNRSRGFVKPLIVKPAPLFVPASHGDKVITMFAGHGAGLHSIVIVGGCVGSTGGGIAETVQVTSGEKFADEPAAFTVLYLKR